MTTRPGTHHAVITAALEDWWITTEPDLPFTPDDVADRVEQYLVSSGYRITRRTPLQRAAAALTGTAAVLALAALGAATVGAAWQQHWTAATLGALAVTAFALDNYRNHRTGNRT